MKQGPTRSEVPTEQTRNLADLFATDADGSAEYAALNARTDFSIASVASEILAVPGGLVAKCLTA